MNNEDPFDIEMFDKLDTLTKARKKLREDLQRSIDNNSHSGVMDKIIAEISKLNKKESKLIHRMLVLLSSSKEDSK